MRPGLKPPQVKLLRTLLLATIVTGCSTSPSLPISTSQTDSTPTPAATVSARRQFETAIARRILFDVRKTLPSLDNTERAAYLHDKQEQFDRAVDLNLVSSGIRQEFEILGLLLTSAEADLGDSNYGLQVSRLTSLDWSMENYKKRVMSELDRMDQIIAVLASDSPRTFNLEQHYKDVRDSAEYPEDSFSGRQDYLDTLYEAMLATQLEWHEVLEHYQPSELGLLGEEDSDTTLEMVADGLVINLEQVGNLPFFEIPGISVFYGFPGLQAFSGVETADSLKYFLELPAYNYGWAGYILEFVATRKVYSTLPYLYLSKLLAGLALADLQLHTGQWRRSDAVQHLFETTPYSRSRIELMLNSVAQNPGLYLAAISGKIYFSHLQSRCLEKQLDCEQQFHQSIVELGPLPFSVLEERMGLVSIVSPD